MSKDEIIGFVKNSIDKMYQSNSIHEIEQIENQLKSVMTDYIIIHPNLKATIIGSQPKLDALILHAKNRLDTTTDNFVNWEEFSNAYLNTILTVFQ